MGFMILGIISSLPEVAIAIQSSSEVPELSLGNLIGGSLVLLTLILGITIVKFKNVHFRGKFNQDEILMVLGVVGLGSIFVLDADLSILESAILIGLYVFYVIHLYSRYYRLSKSDQKPLEITVPATKLDRLLIMGLVGIVLLFISSSAIVEVIIRIGELTEFNEALMGIFVLGVGTNLPEIVILLRARDNDHEKLAIGNFIGSTVFNIAIVGLLGIMTGGFEIEQFDTILIPSVFLAMGVVLFGIFSWTERQMKSIEGVGLICLYLLFLVAQAFFVVL